MYQAGTGEILAKVRVIVYSPPDKKLVRPFSRPQHETLQHLSEELVGNSVRTADISPLDVEAVELLGVFGFGARLGISVDGGNFAPARDPVVCNDIKRNLGRCRISSV